QKAKVLVVGTFHLDYPGLDAHKASESNKIDVLQEPKKSELTALIDYIKKFRPNKIAIEAIPKWDAVEKLQKYKKGAFRGERDERFQIAFRVAKELRLDTLFSIDEWSFAVDLAKL